MQSARISLASSALLVVDAQQGFSSLCPQELPVSGALDIVPHINTLLALPWKRIDASQDWHPPDHCSFLGQRDNLYPPHCVQGTRGADFLPGLHSQRFHIIWRKGFESQREAYAITAQHPHFLTLLRTSGIDTVVICGLATNICCFHTACDLRKAGFRVLLVEDACAGVDVPSSQAVPSQDQARAEGLALGIEYVRTAEVCDSVSPSPGS